MFKTTKSICIRCGGMSVFRKMIYGGGYMCPKCGFGYTKEGRDHYLLHKVLKDKKEPNELKEFIVRHM